MLLQYGDVDQLNRETLNDISQGYIELSENIDTYMYGLVKELNIEMRIMGLDFFVVDWVAGDILLWHNDTEYNTGSFWGHDMVIVKSTDNHKLVVS